MESKPTKISKSYRLSPKVLEAIRAYKDEHKITESAALEQLVLRGSRATTDAETAFFEKMDAFFHSWKTGLLLSCRQTERYAFMIIEMLNSFISSTTTTETDIYYPTYRLEAERAKNSNNQDQYLELKEKAGTNMYRGAAQETKEFFAYVKQLKDNRNDGDK